MAGNGYLDTCKKKGTNLNWNELYPSDIKPSMNDIAEYIGETKCDIMLLKLTNRIFFAEIIFVL